MMTDSHCHLYSSEFENDLEAMMDKALANSINKFYMPAIDCGTHDRMIAVEKKYPGSCYAMMGLHPCSVNQNFTKELAIIEGWLRTRKFAAIGETGLDFHWDKTFVDQQYISLKKHTEWALEYNLPMVLHTRDAMQESIDFIKQYSGTSLRGIFHCFGGTLEEANQIIEAGFLLGIGGVVTYKNSGLAGVLNAVDLQHIVLETDAPYLAPVPFRGKRNESSYLIYIADAIAGIKNVSRSEVERITTENAERMFN